MRIFQDDQIRISRLKTTSGSKMAYVATATADATIQPLGKGQGQLDTGLYGSTYVAYCDDSVPVQKGDRIKDRDGNIYNVDSVITRPYGSFPYKEIILKRSK